MAITSQCKAGTQNNFSWQTTSKWDTSQNPLTAFGTLRGTDWVIGTLADRDLTISCTHDPALDVNGDPLDPNFFVDGDPVNLDCLVTNLGTAPSNATTTVRSFFSTDEFLDSGDTLVQSISGFTTLAGGASRSVQISAQPQMTVAGNFFLCTKIDVDPSNLNKSSGLILETDETNNNDCQPITVRPSRKDLVVDPSDPNEMLLRIGPDPVAPMGLLRAGLDLTVDFNELNQGTGAVRLGHRNIIKLNSTTICGVTVPAAIGSSGILRGGGFKRNFAFGLGTGSSTEECGIPFSTLPGSYTLTFQLDSLGNILEQDPTGNSGPAESNNTLTVPITVNAALDPEFRPQVVPKSPATNVIINVTGTAGTGDMTLGVASAADLGAYALRLTWAPANLVAIGDPNQPAGDPNKVVFTNFLESRGLIQSCGVTAIDNSAGTLDIACTTAQDPNNPGGLGAQDNSAALATITFTAVTPGTGTLIISNLTAKDGAGATIATRIKNGTISVTGTAEVSVINPVPPTAVYPSELFSASWDIFNNGFGPAKVPLITQLILSEDLVSDPTTDDAIACQSNESTPFPAKTVQTRPHSNCKITQDLRPGNYNGFFQLKDITDPNTLTIAPIPLLPRVVALRKAGQSRIAETSGPPDQMGGTTGSALAFFKKYQAKSLATVKSVSRDRNWLVGYIKHKSSPGKLLLSALPQRNDEKPLVLEDLRVSKDVKAVLGGVDIDGDGNSELILLKSTKSGDTLAFRRIDYTQRRPVICQAAAVTDPNATVFTDPNGPFAGRRIVSAGGIEYDSTPIEELAVLTDDGKLTIFDVTISGTLPPAAPCKPVPTIPLTAATLDLVPIADDPNFGTSGGEAISIRAMDFGLDGVEEIAALFDDTSGTQSLRIYEAPASLAGTANLIADDPDYGKTQSRKRSFAIACTR
ncbi:MAG TPA: hypothetical protein VNI57_08505 [Candidatus Saccharimonadales bacterium]|nr:hypothetical protein [Candidatus Saccharimonadales bacterium]